MFVLSSALVFAFFLIDKTLLLRPYPFQYYDIFCNQLWGNLSWIYAIIEILLKGAKLKMVIIYQKKKKKDINIFIIHNQTIHQIHCILSLVFVNVPDKPPNNCLVYDTCLNKYIIYNMRL